ncbi:hypothetical protein GCM10028857_15080 [Salinarchaeum chitinilyticum]
MDTRSVVSRLDDALGDYRIETTDSIESVTDGSVSLEAVACVVAVDPVSDGSGIDLAERLDRGERSPPVVLVPEHVDEEVALATTAGASAIVPPGALDRLAETVDAEGSAYLERIADAREVAALETLFDQIEDVFQIKDAEGRYRRLLSNREWPAASEAVGKTDRVLHDDQFDLNERYYEEDGQVLSTGEPIVGEITGYGEGPLFWLETTKVPLQDDSGEITGLVGHVRDVSERMHHRQELQSKNDRLDRFASYVSHDLKNPLSIATGYLDLAREGDEEALDAVDDAIGRMEELVDDVEILARGEQQLLRADSDATLQATKHSIAAMVRNVWTVLATDRATLEVELPDDAVVYASEAEFRSMVENLLTNAIDHGGADVTVRVGRTESGFYVEDDGPGVPEDDRERIFEQGYSTANGGTGTGLAIVSEVAAAHEWEVAVTTGREGGARFEISNCLLVPVTNRSPALGAALDLTDATDVGNPGEPGHAEYDPDRDAWTVSGAGEDIWGGENDFHFVYATVSGDLRLQARVAGVHDVYEFSKAGVMVRDNLEEDSCHGYVGLTRDLIEVLWCDSTGAPTTSQHLRNADRVYDWIRIDREGDRLTVAVSADGETWHPIDQRRISCTEPVHAGLAVCSAVHRDSCTAIFEDVALHRLDDS